MNVPPRVLYRERQRLRAGDLQAEQGYLLGLAGRHHLGPHEWGVVRGLAISLDVQKNAPTALATIAVGLAIDGYGRELLLSSVVQTEFQADHIPRYVYIYYCQRPKGGCGDLPNSRWRDSAEISVTKEPWPVPEDEPPEDAVLKARAAGVIPEEPPWPVLLGIIDNGKVDLTDVRFARLRAARIVSPSRRSVVRIGQESLADLYQLRVTLQDSKGVPRDRFAIDRDGDAWLWGNLVLLGTSYSAIIATQKRGLLIMVQSKLAGGSDILWRATPETGKQGEPILKLSFRRESSAEKPVSEEFALGEGLQEEIERFNRKRSSPVRLSLVTLADPIVLNAKKKAADVRNTPVLDDRELPLEPSGAVLRFSREEKAAAPEPCGCRSEVETEPQLPEGLVFKPAAAAPTLPSSRDIYSIQAKDANKNTVEELRLSGGVLVKGDFKRRVAIGGSIDPNPFESWLTARGDGSIELPGGKLNDEGNAYPMIQVTGTTEYPPVKPDPRDPLFNYLLTLAFINGVLSVSSSLLKITFSKLPDFIDTSQPSWQYELSLQNLGLTEPLLAKSNTERISSGQQSLLKTNPNLPQKIDPQTTAPPVTITHTPQDVPTGHKVTIEVSVAMLAGSLTVGASVKSAEIPVYAGPIVDLSDVPDSVPPNTPWDFKLKITNQAQATKPLTVSAIQVDGSGGSQAVPPPPPPPAQLGAPFVSNPIPQAAQPDGAAFTIKATLTYTWDGTTTALALTSPPVNVAVKKHLTPAASMTGAGTYEVKLKNTGGQSLTLRSFQVRIYRTTAARPVNPHFSSAAGFSKSLDPGDEHTEAVNAPTPSGAQMKVDVDLVYERAGRTWTTNDTSARVAIP